MTDPEKQTLKTLITMRKETAKYSFELEAAYLRGMQDSAKFLTFLGILSKEVTL